MSAGFTPERVCMRCEQDGATVCSCPAPDLYAALEAMVDGVSHAEKEQLLATSWMRNCTDAKLSAARAAIAKARGDSSIATLGATEVGADPALAVPAKPVSRLGATRCDPGESK